MTAHPSRPRAPHNAGFLLTETLATFAVSAFVLVALASTAPVLLRAIDRSVAGVQEVDDLGRTLAALQRDLSGLDRARWNGFEPQPFVFRGGPNSLFFARRERRPDGTGELRVIALREIVTDGGTRLLRGDAHLSANALSFDDLHFGPQRTLATGPGRLRFWYVPPPDKDGKTAPREKSWRTGPRLPAAIEIEAVDARTTRLILAARVPIHANADIGCLDSKGPGNAPGNMPGIMPGTSAPPPSGAPAVPAAVPASSASSAFCGRDDTRSGTLGTPPPSEPTL